jgi:hypothetical protein
MDELGLSETEMDAEERVGPLMKFRAGPLVATVWSNHASTEEGLVAVKRVQLQRLYKDPQGQWRTTGRFRPQDLAGLGVLLMRVYEEVAVVQE